MEQAIVVMAGLSSIQSHVLSVKYQSKKTRVACTSHVEHVAMDSVGSAWEEKKVMVAPMDM